MTRIKKGREKLIEKKGTEKPRTMKNKRVKIRKKKINNNNNSGKEKGEMR